MSKSDKQNNRGAVASRSECAYKTLDNERRLIDDLIQVRILTFDNSFHLHVLELSTRTSRKFSLFVFR